MASVRTSSTVLRRVVVPLVLLGGSLVVTFGVLEVSLRALYPPPARFLYPQESYDFDSEIGYVLRPRQTAFTHDRPVRTNALGLRDHEVDAEPAPGTVRILALGDSQTFGNGLDLVDTWPKQLERRAGRGRWEVINAGIPGTDTWQHEIILRRLLTIVKPRVVVLALYVNDVVPRHDPRAAALGEQTNTSMKRLAYLAKRSSVVTWVYHRLVVPWSARHTEQSGSVEYAVLVGSQDARAERGWQQVERSLAAMKDLCEARHASLLIAILPRRDQIAARVDGHAFNERARAVARSHAIEAVDLLPSLSADYRVHGEALFVAWDGHNSAVTNRVIAAELGEPLQRLVSPPGGAGR